MHVTLLFLALIVGTFMPLQSGINAMLQHHWSNSAPLASLISFSVGTLCVGLYVFVLRIPVPALSTSTAPWYAWLGGLLGAIGVTSLIYIAPRIGALAMVSLVILGQVVGSMLFDHFGLVGYAVRPVTVMRIVGVALLVGGVFLVNKY